MENKINEDDFRFIDIEFLSKSELSTSRSSYDAGGEFSLDFLKWIITSKEPLIKTLSLVYDMVKKKHAQSSNCIVNGYRMPFYHFIWGRIIVEFYYFYHDMDSDKLKKIVNKMLEYHESQHFEKATRSALNQVDAYYNALVDWEENVENLINTSASSFSVADNRKKDVMKVLNYMFDLNMFCTKDGKPLNRQKKQFMIAMGKFFNSDFEKYAQIVNKAAQEPNYPGVFEEMLRMANDKYTDNYK